MYANVPKIYGGKKSYVMPMNGEKNEQFGVYKSVCCGAEIVIAEGLAFPDCPKHPKLPTKWKSTTDEPIPHAKELRKRNNSDDSAA